MKNKKKFGRHSADSGLNNPHSAFYTPQSRGFTLIEIIITIVIVGIISGIAAMIILQGVRAYSDEQSRSDMHYQARFAVERMAREMRMIRQSTEFGAINSPAVPVLGTITNNPSNVFSFVDMTGTTVTYSLTGTTLNRSAGGVNALAQGVTALSFTCFDNAGNQLANGSASTSAWTAEIAVTDTQGTETLQMRTRVHPMNF
jgi:prepilin-type N-terminal cleavage/methylation domain-containing protein